MLQCAAVLVLMAKDPSYLVQRAPLLDAVSGCLAASIAEHLSGLCREGPALSVGCSAAVLLPTAVALVLLCRGTSSTSSGEHCCA